MPLLDINLPQEDFETEWASSDFRIPSTVDLKEHHRHTKKSTPSVERQKSSANLSIDPLIKENCLDKEMTGSNESEESDHFDLQKKTQESPSLVPKSSFVEPAVAQEQLKQDMEVKEQEIDSSEYESEDDPEMLIALGFKSFGTTKHKSHDKTTVEGVFKNKNHTRKYRQYMNRPGGFNKNLDKMN